MDRYSRDIALANQLAAKARDLYRSSETHQDPFQFTAQFVIASLSGVTTGQRDAFEKLMAERNGVLNVPRPGAASLSNDEQWHIWKKVRNQLQRHRCRAFIEKVKGLL